MRSRVLGVPLPLGRKTIKRWVRVDTAGALLPLHGWPSTLRIRCESGGVAVPAVLFTSGTDPRGGMRQDWADARVGLP